MNTPAAVFASILAEEESPFEAKEAALKSANGCVQPLAEPTARAITQLVARHRLGFCRTKADAAVVWKLLAFHGINLDYKVPVEQTLQELATQSRMQDVAVLKDPEEQKLGTWIKTIQVPFILRQWEDYKSKVAVFNKTLIEQYHRSHPRSDPRYSRFFHRVSWTHLWDNELWNRLEVNQREQIDMPSFGKPEGELPGSLPDQTPEYVLKSLSIKPQIAASCQVLARHAASEGLARVFFAGTVFRLALDRKSEKEAENKFAAEFRMDVTQGPVYPSSKQLASSCAAPFRVCANNFTRLAEAVLRIHNDIDGRAVGDRKAEDILNPFIEADRSAARELRSGDLREIKGELKLGGPHGEVPAATFFEIIARPGRFFSTEREIQLFYDMEFLYESSQRNLHASDRINEKLQLANLYRRNPSPALFKHWSGSMFARWAVNAKETVDYFQLIQQQSQRVLITVPTPAAFPPLTPEGYTALREHKSRRVETLSLCIYRAGYESFMELAHQLRTGSNSWEIVNNFKNKKLCTDTATQARLLAREYTAHADRLEHANVSFAISNLAGRFAFLNVELKLALLAESRTSYASFLRDLAEAQRVAISRIKSWSRVAAREPRVEAAYFYRFVHRCWRRVLQERAEETFDLSALDRIDENLAVLNELHQRVIVHGLMVPRIRARLFECMRLPGAAEKEPEEKTERGRKLLDGQLKLLLKEPVEVECKVISDLENEGSSQLYFAARKCRELATAIASEMKLDVGGQAHSLGAIRGSAVQDTLLALQLFDYSRRLRMISWKQLKEIFLLFAMICVLIPPD